MSEFVVYVLYSQKYRKTYTGQTADLIARFKSHNTLGTKGYTLKYRPWTVIHLEFFKTRGEAIKHEKFLKSGKGRAFVKKLIPE